MKKWILAVVFALTVFFSLVTASCGFVVDDGTSEPAPLRVSFLDVGQGLAVLLEYGGRFALYDTGPDSVGVVDSLVARGVDTLEWVVMSHSHRDHAGGILELGGAAGSVWAGNAPRVHVRHLYVGPDTAGSFVRDSVLGLARRFDIPVDTLVRGSSLGQISGCGSIAGGDCAGSGDVPQFDVLWPPDYVHESGNPASVVLRAEFGAASMLLTGDLDSAGERRLLELSPTLSADLLQVPHHGSAGSSSLRFVAQVAPDYAVASVGAGNSYGHPREEVVRKYGYVLGDTARFFRTDRDGTVEFELWPDIGVVTGRD